MGVTKVTLDGAKGMLYYGLPLFVILRILFDVVVVYVYSILVFAAVYNALG